MSPRVSVFVRGFFAAFVLLGIFGASGPARAAETSILKVEPPKGAIVTITGPGFPSPLRVTGLWEGAIPRGIYSVKIDATPPWVAIGAFGSGGFADASRTTFDLSVSAPHVLIVPRVSTWEPSLNRQRQMEVTFAGRADASEAWANVGHPRTPGGNVSVGWYGSARIPRGATPPRVTENLRVAYFRWYASFDLLPDNPDRVDLHLRRLSARYGRGVISVREVLPGGNFEPGNSNAESDNYESAPPTRSVPGGEGLGPTDDGLVVMEAGYFYRNWRNGSIRRVLEIAPAVDRTEAVYAGPANSNRALAPKFLVVWTEKLLPVPLVAPIDLPVTSEIVAPRFLVAPVPLTLRAGASSALEISVLPVDATIRWEENGTPIPGAHGPRLEIAAATPTGVRTYTAIASNAAGIARASATLTILPKLAAPVITAQPANTRATVGRPFALVANATGDDLSFAWFKNNSAIAGEASSSLHRAAAAPADVGDYYARISNAAGSVNTLVVSVTVTQAEAPPVVPTPTAPPPAPVGAVAPRPTSPPPAQLGSTTPPQTPVPTNSAAPVPVAIVFAPNQAKLMSRLAPLAVRLAVIDAAGRTIEGAQIYVEDSIARQTRIVSNRTPASGYVDDTISLPPFAKSAIYSLRYIAVTRAGQISATLDVLAYAAPLPGEQAVEFDAAGFGGLGRFAIKWPSNPALATEQQRRAHAAFLLDRLHAYGQAITFGDTLQLIEIATILSPLGAGPLTIRVVRRAIIEISPIVLAEIAKRKLAQAAAEDPALRPHEAALRDAIDHGKNAWQGVFVLADGSIDAFDIVQAVDGIVSAVFSPSGEITAMEFTRHDHAGTSVARLIFSKPVSSATPARINAFSARVEVGASIAPTLGVQVEGSGNAQFLLRGIGPALGAFAPDERVTARDPRITLTRGNRVIATNDNWTAADLTMMSLLNASALTAGSLDAAISTRLGAAGYTIGLGAEPGKTRTAWIELFADSSARPRATLFTVFTQCSNASTIVPQLRIAGAGTLRVLVRAAGPALRALKMSSAMDDPEVQILGGGDSPIAENNDWQIPAGKNARPPAEVAAAATRNGLMPLAQGSRDAALLVELPAGTYSIKLRGSGVVMLEVAEVVR